MTWKHIAAIMIAACMVVICGLSNNCSANFSHISMLATAIVSGAMGNAMKSIGDGPDKPDK